MKLIIKISLFIITLNIIVFGQNITAKNYKVRKLKNLHSQTEKLQNSIDLLEKERDSLTDALGVIDDKDRKEAEKLKAIVIRLYPCCSYIDRRSEIYGMNSYYEFFNEDGGDQHFTTALIYQNNIFRFPKNEHQGSHGFFTNLGKISIENINEQTPAFTALAKYQPPTVATKIDYPIKLDVKDEFITDGFTFKREIPVKVGDTYILRVINYESDSNLDKIFALNVHRQDVDGSLIIFLKLIKKFEPPKLNNLKKDPMQLRSEIHQIGLLETIRIALREKGFTEIFIEPNETRGFILRGNISVERFREAFKIIKEIDPTETFKNEIPNIPESLLNPFYNSELERDVKQILQANGFKDVVFDTSTIPATLRGTVPKGKMLDVIKIVQELVKKPVKNEMTEK